MRERVWARLGEGLVVRRGPGREAQVVKRVVGRAKVGKSLAVKR